VTRHRGFAQGLKYFYIFFVIGKQGFAEEVQLQRRKSLGSSDEPVDHLPISQLSLLTVENPAAQKENTCGVWEVNVADVCALSRELDFALENIAKRVFPKLKQREDAVYLKHE
jgi:hypothetical protein